MEKFLKKAKTESSSTKKEFVVNDQKDPKWHALFESEFGKSYFVKLQETLAKEEEMLPSMLSIYPPKSLIFNAFHLCPFDDIKVVILGQNPYVLDGQAMGLSFSVPNGVAIPPSLKNIFAEIVPFTTEEPILLSGDLTHWTKQGVFLLNSHLTVRSRDTESHMDIGWDTFTAKVIETIAKDKEGVVFLLWGAHAKSKSKLLIPYSEKQKHYVLTSSHPSPKSVDRGFKGCDHFRKANAYLEKMGKTTIKWI